MHLKGLRTQTPDPGPDPPISFKIAASAGRIFGQIECVQLLTAVHKQLYCGTYCVMQNQIQATCVSGTHVLRSKICRNIIYNDHDRLLPIHHLGYRLGWHIDAPRGSFEAFIACKVYPDIEATI